MNLKQLKKGKYMTFNELKKILKGEYVDYFYSLTGEQKIRLDGEFTLEQLKVIFEFLQSQK